MRTVKNHQLAYLKQYTDMMGDEAFTTSIFDCFKFPDLAMIENEKGNRILILSPHQDDDILGCGGTIKLLRNAGADVKVIYMTDGCMGSNTISPIELPSIRKQEAIRALSRLNVHKSEFYGIPDLCLRCDSSAISFVKGQISSFRPKMIMTPHAGEYHPDHYNTCMIAAKALARIKRPIDVYAYEVWVSHDPNTLVDITDVIEDKLSALREHHSQMAMVDYAEKIQGLNVYRSINNVPSSKYSEAFLRFTREDFIIYADSKSRSSQNFDIMAL